jgi:hypothetical protein
MVSSAPRRLSGLKHLVDAPRARERLSGVVSGENARWFYLSIVQHICASVRRTTKEALVTCACQVYYTLPFVQNTKYILANSAGTTPQLTTGPNI